MEDTKGTSSVKGKALIKDLGIMVGLLTPDPEGAADQFKINQDWIKNPKVFLEKVPTEKVRRDALVAVFDDAWGERTTESPLLDLEDSRVSDCCNAFPKRRTIYFRP